MRKIYPKILLSALVLLCSAAAARAQFYLGGTDRGSTCWMSIDSPHYRIIYPAGIDSLARVYAIELESWRVAAGASAGYTPCQFQKHKMPVVLHNEHAVSNGSVVWAPSRMELYTTPDQTNVVPMPWETNLAIHEQRHVAQMQTGLTGILKPVGWFFGDMLNGAVSALYGGSMWMEGDAVVAETALTNSGRGRMATFLDYYMYSFDNGQWRDWHSWSNGSQRYYTPDHYPLGYMLLAGVRYNYNVGDLSGRRFTDFSKHPFRWGSGIPLRKVSGMNLHYTFMTSAHTFYDKWREEADARAPYTAFEAVTAPGSRYQEYSSLAYSPKGLFAVLKGLLYTPQLVRIDPDNGNVKRIREFGYYSDGMHLDATGDRLVWHEIIGDSRWELKSRSVIKAYDIESGRIKTLTRKGMLFNPAAGPDGGLLVTMRLESGRTAVGLLKDGDKNPQILAKAPDGLQIVETCFFENEIYASGLSADGFGIYKIENDELHSILEPQAVAMCDFGVEPDGHIHFCSDLEGSEQYYHFDPADGSLHRLVSTRYGGGDWHFSPDGEWLYYSAYGINGKQVMRTASDSLFFVPTDFTNRHKWVIADRLSEQERELGAAKDNSPVTLSEPKKYRKFPHLFRVHSWAPVYFSYDNISALSFDDWYSSAAPGVTVMTQNSLGTLYGYFGYSIHPDPDDDNATWRHTGHINLTYTGLYPVFETTLDLNDRRAHSVGFNVLSEDGKTGTIHSNYTVRDGVPLVNFYISSYIPWKFNRGGIYTGFIPKIYWNLSNDTYDTVPQWWLKQTTIEENGYEAYSYEYLGKNGSSSYLKQNIGGSIRAYAISGTPTSAVYPRYGIGIEAGYRHYIQKSGLNTVSGEKKLFSPLAYGYIYAYLPGITRQQGLRITAKYGRELDENRMYSSYIVNTMPRGLQNNSSAVTAFCTKSIHSLAFTADYAVPIWISDLHIGNFAYIKRLVLTPHFDYSLAGDKGFDKSLYSAGCDFNLDFGTLFWIKYDMSAGLRVDYNGGKSFDALTNNAKHWYFGPLFSVSF